MCSSLKKMLKKCTSAKLWIESWFSFVCSSDAELEADEGTVDAVDEDGDEEDGDDDANANDEIIVGDEDGERDNLGRNSRSWSNGIQRLFENSCLPFIDCTVFPFLHVFNGTA